MARSTLKIAWKGSELNPLKSWSCKHYLGGIVLEKHQRIPPTTENRTVRHSSTADGTRAVGSTATVFDDHRGHWHFLLSSSATCDMRYWSKRGSAGLVIVPDIDAFPAGRDKGWGDTASGGGFAKALMKWHWRGWRLQRCKQDQVFRVQTMNRWSMRRLLAKRDVWCKDCMRR